MFTVKCYPTELSHDVTHITCNKAAFRTKVSLARLTMKEYTRVDTHFEKLGIIKAQKGPHENQCHFLHAEVRVSHHTSST